MARQPSSSATSNQEGHRPPGRPRSADADDAILRATLELLAEAGLQRTTIAAVAARAGVARATVYLRWASHDHLIAAAARHALGRPPFPLSRDLDSDLRLGARETQHVLGRPAFLAIFPELVRAVLAKDPAMSYDELAPNRQRLALEYSELAEAQGFRADIDPTVAFDLLVGSHLNHILATGRPPSPKVAAQIADVILAGLRASTPAAVTKPRSSRPSGSRATRLSSSGGDGHHEGRDDARRDRRPGP